MKTYTVTELTNMSEKELEQHEKEVWAYYKKVDTTLRFMRLEE